MIQREWFLLKRVNGRRMRMRGTTIVDVVVGCMLVAAAAVVAVPSLEQKNENSHMAVCRKNMERLGKAHLGFAEDHQGRFAGQAQVQQPVFLPFSWQQVLNHEYFGHELNVPFSFLKLNSQTIRFIDSPEFGDDIKKKLEADPDYVAPEDQIWCPAKQPQLVHSSRAYLMNIYAAAAMMPLGIDGGAGKMIEHPDKRFLVYRLGMKVSDFEDPGFSILHQETEKPSDYFTYRAPDGIRMITKEQMEEFGLPEYVANVSGNIAEWSFRHEMMANILFMDGRVKLMGPEDELNTEKRILPKKEVLMR